APDDCADRRASRSGTRGRLHVLQPCGRHAGDPAGRRQQGHPCDATQALRDHPELESKHRIEHRSSLLHLRLTNYVEEVEMLDLEACWSAVESRDVAAGSRFFYGVRTTGVYCRPGCASRRPLRANTRFFETTVAAEAAGFRACKRCRPADG